MKLPLLVTLTTVAMSALVMAQHAAPESMQETRTFSLSTGPAKVDPSDQPVAETVSTETAAKATTDAASDAAKAAEKRKPSVGRKVLDYIKKRPIKTALGAGATLLVAGGVGLGHSTHSTVKRYRQRNEELSALRLQYEMVDNNTSHAFVWGADGKKSYVSNADEVCLLIDDYYRGRTGAVWNAARYIDQALGQYVRECEPIDLISDEKLCKPFLAMLEAFGSPQDLKELFEAPYTSPQLPYAYQRSTPAASAAQPGTESRKQNSRSSERH